MNRNQPAFPPRERRANPPGSVARVGSIFLSGCGVILILGGLLMWLNHQFPSCRNDNFRSQVSPDGKLKLVSFRRTCAANSYVSTDVSIIRADEKLPEEAGTIFSAQGEPNLTLRWICDSQVFLHAPEGTRINLRVSKFCEIQVTDEVIPKL